jgi:hypothetical protein
MPSLRSRLERRNSGLAQPSALRAEVLEFCFESLSDEEFVSLMRRFAAGARGRGNGPAVLAGFAASVGRPISATTTTDAPPHTIPDLASTRPIGEVQEGIIPSWPPEASSLPLVRLPARHHRADRDVVAVAQGPVGGEQFAVADDQGVVDAKVKFTQQLEDGFDFFVGDWRFVRAQCYGDHGLAM